MQIDQKAFKIWLDSQPPERVIESANGSACFLCSFLKETCLVSAPTMSWHEWWGGAGGCYLIPNWALRLIKPEWCSQHRCGPFYTLTAGQMQQRYRELFPELPLRADGTPDLEAILKI